MTIELWEPPRDEDVKFPPASVRNMLLIVGSNVPLASITNWTLLERAIAYDWAAREHSRASDNRNRRREKPQFVTLEEVPPHARNG